MKKFNPPATIGIIGGGQLGMMMAMEAKLMGYRVHSYDVSEQASITRYSDSHWVGEFDDLDELFEFGATCDVLTYEFENISAAAMHQLAQKFVLPQGANALVIASHRQKEIEFAQSLNIPIPNYSIINSKDDLLKHGDLVGYPMVLKAMSGGYDGHGQRRYYSKEDVEQDDEYFVGIAQEWIKFEREVSVVCTRAIDGVFCFEPIENVHERGILKVSSSPTTLKQTQIDLLEAYTESLVTALDYYGTFAVEYFVTQDQLFFNEMACRPHNSGHLTIEAYTKSQFHTHLLAICGKPIGDNPMNGVAGMVNLLGEELESAKNNLVMINQHKGYLHDYFKSPRPFRKRGHVTFISKDILTLQTTINQLRRKIKPYE